MINVGKFVLGVVLVSGGVMSAQETATPKYEVGINYSWLHVNSANFDLQRTGNGGSGYFEYNLNKTVGLIADFGGYANTREGINEKLMTYMFGPRFNWRHSRFSPMHSSFSVAHIRGITQLESPLHRTPLQPLPAAVWTIV
jgi:hypothetical protein